MLEKSIESHHKFRPHITTKEYTDRSVINYNKTTNIISFK